MENPMRSAILSLALLIPVLAGCNKSPEGGVAGTSNSFTLTGPTVPTSIKQNNKESVKFTLNRGSDFKQDVKLSVSSVDKLKLELNKDVIKASDASPAEFTVTVSPATDAPVADHKVIVTGTPANGGTPTSVEIVVKVSENK
jgi:hypothetical protein